MNAREHFKLALEIAGWEFRRYFKWKDLLVGFLFFTLLSGGVFFAGKLLGSSSRQFTVAVLGQGELARELPQGSRLQWVPAAGRSEEELRAAVKTGELDALLLVDRERISTLVVRKEAVFQAEIQALLDAEALKARLAARGLTAEDLSSLLAPAKLEVVYEGGAGPKSKAVKTTAMILVLAMLLGTFLSLSYIFTGITAEKQQRVTEQVIAIVGPQPWIDGKILGIAAYVLSLLGNMSFGSLLLVTATWSLKGGAFPLAAVPLGSFFLCALLTVLGLLLWNAFFAAIAATVNDPNTSQKSQVLFLPLLPLLLGLTVLKNPDSLLSQVLAILPFTSPAALPARYALSVVSPIEVVAAILLLVATILFFRRAAGRIFEIGMLMYGKEPSWNEIVKWARTAPEA